MPNRRMYAVAIRDIDGLWLLERISCSMGLKGGVSVLPPRDDPRFAAEATWTPCLTPWNPHVTYHRNGQLHFRSYSGKPIEAKPFLITQRQRLNASFHGIEPVFALPIQPGAAILHRTRCIAGRFDGVFEIPIEQFPEQEHHTLAVDLVEYGKSTPYLGPWQHVIVQKSFQDLVPEISILATLWRGMAF
jgi:hypothetical protein